jgi:hypothetical protein
MNHRFWGTVYYTFSIVAGGIWGFNIVIGNGVRVDIAAFAAAALALGEICVIKHRLGIE